VFSPPEPLAAHHDVSVFDCTPALNAWLRTHMRRNEEKGFTRVLVVCEGVRVAGYYGFAPTGVPSPLMPRSIRKGQALDAVPCILFGQRAVDLAYRARGLGSALLRDALKRCVAGAMTIGGRAVIVRAVDIEAEAYWRSNGFIPAIDDSSILFRSIGDIAAWLDQASASGS
jgi:GNAT superfamily N-acetyltransferase